MGRTACTEPQCLCKGDLYLTLILRDYTRNITYIHIINHYGRSQRQRCLRRGSAAASLLELRVRMPPEEWMFVSCEWRVLSVHKEKSNKMQQCIKSLLFHIYVKLNMFRATHRPSSGAWNCTGSLWFFIISWKVVGHVVGGRCQTMSTNYTSNNLPLMKNQRLPV